MTDEGFDGIGIPEIAGLVLCDRVLLHAVWVSKGLLSYGVLQCRMSRCVCAKQGLVWVERVRVKAISNWRVLHCT